MLIPKIAHAEAEPGGGRSMSHRSRHRTAALRIWHYAGSIFGTPAAAYLSNPRDRGGPAMLARVGAAAVLRQIAASARFGQSGTRSHR
jgi:hypothetical protein